MFVVTVEERVEALEARTRAIEARVAGLEDQAARPQPAAPRAGRAEWARPELAERTTLEVIAPPFAAPRRARPKGLPAKGLPATGLRAKDAATLEDLLGGRVLAWVGGLAVLVGIVFLLAIAVSRGWIGEEARTGMAGVAPLGLLGFGVRLFEHRGRTEAALAATAAGIAGLFATVTVATQIYDLVPALLGMVTAIAVGATATALAVHWRAQGIGALGIVGALVAPLLVGAPGAAGTVALLWVATASATGVLIWQRWNWLGFATFFLTAPQWACWLFDATPPALPTILTITAFGVLYAAAAAGFEVRMSRPRLRVSSTILLALSAFTCAAVGWFALDDVASRAVADGWLVAVAVAHGLAGAAGLRSKRVSHELALVALGLGTILADVAFAQIASGLPLVLGWVAGMVGFAGLLKHARRGTAAAGGDEPATTRRADSAFAALGLGGHLTLALGHALV